LIGAIAQNSNVRHIELDGINLYQAIPDLLHPPTILQKLEIRHAYLYVPPENNEGQTTHATTTEYELQELTKVIANNSSIQQFCFGLIRSNDIITAVFNWF
jgi:hypothetical protein